MVTVIAAAATLISAVYIMYNRMGLSDELDFGAGSYYYADIPDFDKRVNFAPFVSDVPSWVIFVLFFVWAVAMWFLWKWVDSRGERKK